MPRPTLNLENAETSNAPVAQTVSAQSQLIPLDRLAPDPATENARPGPPPPDEQKRIAELAQSLRAIGQITPLLIRTTTNGDAAYVIDGRRRLSAAQMIEAEDEREFPLYCFESPSIGDATSAYQAAIHANIKRRGYTAIQFAHLAQDLRKQYGWTGTAEVSAFLGVSRATVSEHDKLLKKPDGMSQTDYEDLLSRVASGGLKGEAAFYTLTHVEPERAGEVLARAEELRDLEIDELDDQEAPEGTQTTSEGSKTASTPSGSTRKGKKTAAAKDKPRPKDKEWMKQARAESKKRKAAKAQSKQIKERHVRQAAEEKQAVKAGKEPLQRDLPALQKLALTLRGTAYPDVMRSFISVLFGEWWRGDANDKDVIAAWTAVARLVEECQERKAQNGHHRSSRGNVVDIPVEKRKG